MHINSYYTISIDCVAVQFYLPISTKHQPLVHGKPIQLTADSFDLFK